jgi:hypothetical protein
MVIKSQPTIKRTMPKKTMFFIYFYLMVKNNYKDFNLH